VFNAFLSRRRAALLGLGLALAACGLGLGLPVESRALPCNFEYRHYSNSSYTTIVGRSGNRPQECGCTSYAIGTLTQWRKSGPSYCIEV
jgi:hypothetical protein